MLARAAQRTEHERSGDLGFVCCRSPNKRTWGRSVGILARSGSYGPDVKVLGLGEPSSQTLTDPLLEENPLDRVGDVKKLLRSVNKPLSPQFTSAHINVR